MYEEAIYKAIVDKVEQYGEVYIPVVMVVGAGRGPIVEAAMRAESRSGKAIRLYALDKNPHAMVCLRNKQQLSDRWSRVVLVHSDMRDWTPTEQCDILVSEMLGSFGDNELSPECLQPAEKFIKPDGMLRAPSIVAAAILNNILL
jgi:protein arginine N-methyltransferase 5